MNKSTLPIIFSRGQNESIDPRVAPNDVHAVAQNVRWRKDGRPEKKYGVTAVTTTGLTTDGFATQPVNALTAWNNTPVIAVGSSVRLLTALGWNSQFVLDGQLSHFGPGERKPIVRDEVSGVANPSSGTSGGLVLHAWDNGTTVFCSVMDASGAVVVGPQPVVNGISPRCISTANYVYIVSKLGTGLNLVSFDPTTLALTFAASPGTLDAAGSYFDACGRGSDFLLSYQSAAGVVTTKLFPAVVSPFTPTQTITTAVAVSLTKVGVMGNSTSNIFVAVQEPSAGQVKVQVFNNTLTGSLGVVVVDTDANNNAQPGIALENNTDAYIVWGGFLSSSSTSYMRSVKMRSSGLFTPVRTFYGVAPASKPFLGPAYSALTVEIDGAYIWVATHNADNGSTKWDTQRSYLLVKITTVVTRPLVRQMHAPSVIPNATCQLHLSDVLNLGTGYGYLTTLLNAVRFGGAYPPTFGIDSVTARSIFESNSQAVRDASIAGRVLQFSGGSLYEFGGAAEETGFSNFPVIQGYTLSAGGSLTPSTTYLYRCVYEWLDGQGRRHRSAPSDTVTVAMGGNTQVQLQVSPLVADGHFPNPSTTAGISGVTLHVYRTLAGQSTFHRVTRNVGAPSGSSVGVPTIFFTDVLADSLAATAEFIYTDGGVADNTLCPPHTFHTVCNGRLVVGGQLDRCVLTMSKLLVDGEPTQFSDLDEFNVFLPQECTGLASIDGTIVAFAREKIYFVTGDGPNDQGIGSFNPPVELPTDVGCINWRSVVETSIGVFFQSKRGIFLLPRGFNTPQFVGAEVESTLINRPYVVSSTLVTIPSGSVFSTWLGETTVRFVVGNDPDTGGTTSVLVYDLRTGGWSVDDENGSVLLGGTWSDTFITARKQVTSLRLYAETSGTFEGPGQPIATPNNRFISTKLGTGDIRPFGVAGYGQFDSVVLVGEFRGACFVEVLVKVDMGSESHTFNVQNSDYGDGSVYLDVTPSIKKGSAIQVTCRDYGNPDPSIASEGMIMQALFIECTPIGGTTRLPAARRA